MLGAQSTPFHTRSCSNSVIEENQTIKTNANSLEAKSQPLFLCTYKPASTLQLVPAGSQKTITIKIEQRF